MNPGANAHAANLTRHPRDALTLAQWALWIAFLGVPLRAFSAGYPTVYHAARFLVDLGATMLAFAGLQHLLMQRTRGERNPTAFASGLYFAVYVMAAVVGLTFGNIMVIWTLMGVVPYGAAMCIALGDSRNMFARLWSLFVYQLYVAVPFGFYIVAVVRPADRGLWFSNGDLDGFGVMGMRALYFVPFLLPYMGKMRPLHAYLTAAAYLEVVLLHIEGANRGAVIVYTLMLPVLVVLMTWWQGNGLAGTFRLFKPVMVLALLALPILNLVGEVRPDLDEYMIERVTETIARLTMGSEEDLRSRYEGALNGTALEFSSTENRGGEFMDFVNQMEPADWLIGRGFGGTWISTFWGHEWAMVHVGPGHLLLLGGLPLLLVFLYLWGKAAFGFLGALRTAPEATGCLAVLVTFACSFIQHGPLQDDPISYLFWLCVGMGIALHGKRLRQPRYRSAPLMKGRVLRATQAA